METKNDFSLTAKRIRSIILVLFIIFLVVYIGIASLNGGVGKYTEKLFNCRSEPVELKEI